MQADFAPPPDQGPHHLAQTVLRALSVSRPDPPAEELLVFFFSALYEASFRADHGAPLRGRVVWYAPAEPEPGHLLLTPPLPFSGGTLASMLAGIMSPSALLVSAGDRESLVIQGIAQRAAELPPDCLFSADILGPAQVKVEAGLDYPLELRRNRLHLSTQNVFGRGPVRSRLTALLDILLPAVLNSLPAEIAGSPLLSAEAFPLPGGGVLLQEQQDWAETFARFWTDALISLLRQIREEQRGGLVLLTPRRERTAQDHWLSPPYDAAFPQLRCLLEQRAAGALARQVSAAEELAASLRHHTPPEAFLQEPILPKEILLRDAELLSAVGFLAQLARGDGPLRLTPQLELLSFGGQPGLSVLPERVYLASDETASELIPISSRSFGPRNQALLSLCHQDTNSVGFAFTQDGDLRAMLRQDDKLIVWNNVTLPRL